MKFFMLLFFPLSLFAAEMSKPMSKMNGGCNNYSISLSKEFVAWMQPAVSGTGADLPLGKRVQVALDDHAKVKLVVKPEKKFPSGSKAGVFKLAVSEAGTYRISLGGKMWVDLVDAQGKVVPSDRFEMQTKCESIFKVVEYKLAAGGSYTVQISSSPANSADVLVTRTEEK